MHNLPASSHGKPVDVLHDDAALEIEFRRVVKGEVRFDHGSRAMYAVDGSNSIRQFVERKFYGKYAGSFALPIRDNDSGKVIGVHYRPDIKDKAWRVHPIGTPQTPIIHGNPAEAELVIIAESPFDMDRLIDELQLWNIIKPWAAICTKGAGNALSVPDVFRPEAKILVPMQRDGPAAQDIAKIRGMPKRIPIGETIAYIVRYFGAAQKERWEEVLRIAKDEQSAIASHALVALSANAGRRYCG